MNAHSWLQGGLKLDTGKAPMSLLDRYALEQIAMVLKFGAAKYERDNWRKGIAYTRLTDAALRHIFAFLDGEDKDPESNISHIAHAGCCVLFLLRMIKDRPDLDDRHTSLTIIQELRKELDKAVAEMNDQLDLFQEAS